MSSAAAKRKSSWVWEHFDLLDPGDKVRCVHCHGCYSYNNSSSSTGNMIKHLKCSHVYVACGKQGCSSTDPDQPLLGSFYGPTSTLTPTKKKKITELIVNVIVGDMRPICMVEGIHFKKLMKELAPNYEVPSRSTITESIENKFSCVKNRMKEILRTVKHAALTLDIWSSIAMNSYMGVTLHYVDDMFHMKKLVLATKEFNECHSGHNIMSWLDSVVRDFGIPPHVITSVTTDNASNMAVACRLLKEKYKWFHLKCAAHTLQLCLRKPFDLPQVRDAIGE